MDNKGKRAFEMASPLKNARSLAILTFFGFVAFSPTFFNLFSWDDTYLVLENERIKDISNIAGFFKSTWAGGTSYELYNLQNRPYYRPVAEASLALDYAIAGADPLVFHLTNLVLHIASAIALFYLLRKVVTCVAPQTPPSFLLLVTLLWLVHPVHTEAVALASYRTTLLSGLFLFLSLLFLFSRKISWKIAFGFFFYALSLLSKETSACLPLLLFLLDAYSKNLSKRKLALVYAPLCLVTLLWFLWHQSVTDSGIYDFFGGLSLWQKFLMAFRIFFLYVRLCVLPYPLCPFYDFYVLGVPSSLLESDILAGLVLFVLLVFLAMVTVKSFKLVSLGIAFFFVSLLPFSHIVPFFDPAGERFLYVPLAGFLIATVAGFFFMYQRFSSFRPALRWLAILTAFAFALLTFTRMQKWHDSKTILIETVKNFPNSVEARLGLGRLLLEEGNPCDAKPHLERALTLAKNTSAPFGLLATALAMCKDFKGARDLLMRAPLPERGLPSAVQIVRTELLKRRMFEVLKVLGI
jgi:hypothetical protein